MTRTQTTEGVVTFLDVLGWKGIYGRGGDPLADLERIVIDVRTLGEKLSRGRSAAAISTEVVSVSDTIVIITPATSAEVSSAIELHGALCREALNNGLLCGLPMRGATAWGEVALSDAKSIFLGRAVDEAAAWHELADWIGVILAPSALFATAGSLPTGWGAFAPPLKAGIKFDTLALHWVVDVIEIQRQFVQMSPILPEVVAKFTNTLAFAKLHPVATGAAAETGLRPAESLDSPPALDSGGSAA